MCPCQPFIIPWFCVRHFVQWKVKQGVPTTTRSTELSSLVAITYKPSYVSAAWGFIYYLHKRHHLPLARDRSDQKWTSFRFLPASINIGASPLQRNKKSNRETYFRSAINPALNVHSQVSRPVILIITYKVNIICVLNVCLWFIWASRDGREKKERLAGTNKLNHK